MELVTSDQIIARANQLSREGQKVAILSSEGVGVFDERVIAIELPKNVDELAHSLYSLLRQADELGCDVVLTTVPDEHGLGAAIADRLRRAAGPRHGEGSPQNP